MKVECSSCHARYVIPDEKIPVQGARVRCRKCQAVFNVEPAGASAPTELPLIPPTPQPAAPQTFARDPGIEQGPTFGTPMEPPSTPSTSFGSSAETNPFGAPPEQETQSVPPSPEIERFANAFASSSPAVAPPPVAPAMPAPMPAPPAPSAEVSPFSPSAGIPAGLPEAERLKHERARRLARVLASDIAIYNKEKRDRGIQDGNLVAVLGYEIKKSWEVYKERVTPELANATPYFRDALNEMLAEGKKVF
jgi:predicted Zn finger-like uncharacterized protein